MLYGIIALSKRKPISKLHRMNKKRAVFFFRSLVALSDALLNALLREKVNCRFYALTLSHLPDQALTVMLFLSEFFFDTKKWISEPSLLLIK